MDGFANVMQIGDVCKHLSIAWPGMVSITLPLYCRQINDARSISITQSILTQLVLPPRYMSCTLGAVRVGVSTLQVYQLNLKHF